MSHSRCTRFAFACALVCLVLFTLIACQKGLQPDSAALPGGIVAPGSIGYELFQAHCAACHGSNGRGNGPAAIALNVQPRDFFNEPFRYISTLEGVPTQDDLIQTIKAGRVHGEMPATRWISDEQAAALAEYMRELQRLGLVDRLRRELADDEQVTEAEIEEISRERVAPVEAVFITMPGRGFRPDTHTGRELYRQSCASCHGPAGTGDGLDMPLDELGRPISVRDLTREPIRGGADPVELFKRIRCGVPGTPMPAQEALTDEQVWQLVYYTRFLMGKPLDRRDR